MRILVKQTIPHALRTVRTIVIQFTMILRLNKVVTSFVQNKILLKSIYCLFVCHTHVSQVALIGIKFDGEVETVNGHACRDMKLQGDLYTCNFFPPNIIM